jgi:hypothetical protein
MRNHPPAYYGKKPVPRRIQSSKYRLLSCLLVGTGVTLLACSGFVYAVLSDRKIDRRTDRQQTIFVENNRLWDENLSMGSTAVDEYG